jgi:hypothetical protein
MNGELGLSRLYSDVELCTMYTTTDLSMCISLGIYKHAFHKVSQGEDLPLVQHGLRYDA